MMTVDDKPAKASPAPKSEAAPKNEAAPKSEAASKNKSPSGADQSKPESGGTAADAPPSGYSRGEGQKPVSKAYKDNWNLIFGKKKRR
jgi:hypothetical protein